MAGCCPSGDYHRFFNQRFAGRLTRRDRKRGLDRTARKMVAFLQELGIQGASVLEIGGGVGEVEVELLKAGAARAKNLELSPPTRTRRASSPRRRGSRGGSTGASTTSPRTLGPVAPADLVILHRVVCCYPDYQRLLAAAADHARRALVFSYPPRNALARLLRGVQPGDAADAERLSGLRPPARRDARGAVLEDHGLRRTFQHRGRIWQIAGLERVS